MPPQVTVEYKKENGAMIPVRVHTVLISTQHSPDVTNEKIAADLLEHVIKPIVPAKYMDDKTIFHLNPSGRFVIGGPHGDAGEGRDRGGMATINSCRALCRGGSSSLRRKLCTEAGPQ